MPKRTPTLDEVVHIAREGARELTATDEQVRAEGFHALDGDLWSSMLSELDADTSQALAGSSMAGLFKRFAAELAAHGLKATTDRAKLRPLVSTTGATKPSICDPCTAMPLLD